MQPFLYYSDVLVQMKHASIANALEFLLFCTNTYQFDGLVQGCSDSIANALELQQSCTKSPNYRYNKLCM